MTFIIKKTLCNLLIAIVFLVTSIPVLALKSDTNQPIVIHSLKQSLDIQNNISTFTDNVVITQGSINICADKVVVTQQGSDQSKTYIEAFGDPVTFYQMQKNGKPVKGHAQKVRYNAEKQLATLIGNAYLEQLDSNIKSDHITYLIKQRKTQAFSDKGKHVTTILMPLQLQEKNRKNKSN